MDLTTDMLARFIGGQVEIQNDLEGYMFRGEIEEIEITDACTDCDDAKLSIKLAWAAKAKGYPPLPMGWEVSSMPDYNLSLFMADIGESAGRITIVTIISNETIVLFPKDGSTLDPSKVEGLKLTA